MNTLKEVEVSKEMQYRSKEEVNEIINQINLYYPYTIKKLINSVYFKNYSLSISEDQLTFLIKSLENFCNCLYTFPDVTSFNISNIAMFIIANPDIQKEIYDGKLYDLKERQKVLYLKIKKAIQKINIKEINSDIEVTNMYVDPLNESQQELALVQGKDLENTLIELIEKYNFAYSDILVKYILEIDLDYMMKFRADYSNKNLRKNKCNFVILLNSLNDLIFKIHNVFERDGLFLYKMLELYIFSKEEMKEYFRENLLAQDRKIHSKSMREEYGRNELTLEEEMSYRNNEVLIRGFAGGLSHLKEMYVVRFASFNNCNLSNFKSLPTDIKYNYIKQFFLNLKDKSIFAIYEIHDIMDSEIFEYEDRIEYLKKDVESNKNSILFMSQMLSQDLKTLVINIFNEIAKHKDHKIKDACMGDLNSTGRIMELLSFKVQFSKILFSIILGKSNNDLIWRIYLNNKQIHREYCVCAEDLNRIFIILDKINEECKIQEKYNLI